MTLSREDLAEIQKEAEAYKAAARNAGNAAVELWQARIDMAMAAGGVESVDEIVTPPAGLWDNNNCNCRVVQEPQQPTPAQ